MKEISSGIYRLMLDAVPAAALLIADGVFVECNEYAVRIFNARSRSDLLGKPPSLISPAQQPDGQSSDTKSMKYITAAMGGNPQQFYWRHITLDNKPLDVEVSLKRIDFEGASYLQVSFKLLKAQLYMEQEIAQLVKLYETMAKGDLTGSYTLREPDADTKETYDKLVLLRDAVRGIISNLQANIKDVNRQMTSLTATATDASRSVQDASKSVNQIARNAGAVSVNVQKASESVEQMSKAMQDMSAAVEEITSSMENVSTQANNANASAKSGAQLAENVNRNMNDIADSSTRVYDIVRDIGQQMIDIGKIIVLIRDLASQTNLLALNAAIEAARAGEHGRGFAVVASEVKSLAQESRSSAEKIEGMITQLSEATMKATEAMETAKSLVTKGYTESTQALEAFRQIQKAAETVANSASEVAAATEEQAATTEEVTASVHEVAGLIERTAKEAGDAAAATEESAAAIDEITRMVQTVNTTAVQAMEANRKFRVD